MSAPTAPTALDLPGPSRRIRVEPLRAPASPAPAPTREPAPPDPSPAREPAAPVQEPLPV